MTNTNTDAIWQMLEDGGDDGLLEVLNLSSDAKQVLEQWRHLIGLARILSGREQHALAIVLAAAAGEWSTTFVVEKLLDASTVRGKAIDALNKRRAGKGFIVWSLEDRRIRAAYTELTTEDPEAQAWWKDWTVSRLERHEIVHKGRLTADAAVAKQCIDAAETYIAHLINVAQRFGVPTP